MECFEARYILLSLRGGPYDLEQTLHDFSVSFFWVTLYKDEVSHGLLIHMDSEQKSQVYINAH